MKLSLFLSLPLFCLHIATAQAGQQTLIVSPHGDDRASGTLRKPFRTLERALAETARHPQDTTLILLRGGTYFLTQTIEITGLKI